MSELWRIPIGPNGEVVKTTDFNLVLAFLKQKKEEEHAQLEVQTVALKPPVSSPKGLPVHAVAK